MGESIKFAVNIQLLLEAQNYSGTLFSQTSIIQEMYDHTSFDHSSFALKGFLCGTSVLSRGAPTKVITQLTTFFGPSG
jgi:monoamine oxidase